VPTLNPNNGGNGQRGGPVSPGTGGGWERKKGDGSSSLYKGGTKRTGICPRGVSQTGKSPNILWGTKKDRPKRKGLWAKFLKNRKGHTTQIRGQGGREKLSKEKGSLHRKRGKGKDARRKTNNHRRRGKEKLEHQGGQTERESKQHPRKAYLVFFLGLGGRMTVDQGRPLKWHRKWPRGKLGRRVTINTNFATERGKKKKDMEQDKIRKTEGPAPTTRRKKRTPW